ncbi:MAG TPA: ComF family protein [Terriglobales bacterium]|nr:ComF family protein [Terriglobales bacterium]
MEFQKTFIEIKDSLLDFVFPPHCLLCDSFISSDETNDDSYPRNLVCRSCWDSLTILPHPFCPLCRSLLDKELRRCPKCPQSLPLSLNRSLGIFDPYYQTLIHHFKYSRKFSIGKNLGRRLGEILKKEEFAKDFDYIIPVPLHRSRKRERGYDQSRILAGEISKTVSIPLAEKILIRNKKTKDQTHLTVEERERNVRDAFAVRDSSLLWGKRVILVDDVMTTGATLQECAGVLKDAGAREVIGVTLVVVNP